MTHRALLFQVRMKIKLGILLGRYHLRGRLFLEAKKEISQVLFQYSSVKAYNIKIIKDIHSFIAPMAICIVL